MVSYNHKAYLDLFCSNSQKIKRITYASEVHLKIQW